LHDYGKTPRPGRKVGHCTLLGEDRKTVTERLAALETLLQSLRT
ncbi:MAG: 5-(carboxyamino)imidazole ribonucleotide synthase, partial [Gammaproteobacteria bacterium]|nr:5-(carboxyamino)imidazole ribonucleotide synthase [Gammaproteobacteria bacterium]